MLIVKCHEHFLKVFQFALEHECVDVLIEKLNYLRNYASQPGQQDITRCYLYKGSFTGEHSFDISMRKQKYVNGELMEVPSAGFSGGGLVYHQSSNTWGVHS